MTKLEIYSPFKTNLEELFFHWWSTTIVGQCEDMPVDEQRKWFLSEVETVTKQLQAEMNQEENL